MQRDVRSDETDGAARAAEERNFTDSVDAGAHPIAFALGRLGGTHVTTTWLRRDRPYTVMTEAQFGDLAQVTLAALREGHTAGTASMVKEGCLRTFTARVHTDADPDGDDDHVLAALAEDPGAYRFVLTRGRFVEADGFEIEPDGVAATFDSRKPSVDGVVSLRLVWVDDACR
jgi:hypothetical protein